MAKNIFKINENFLKKHGIELQSTGAMFTPYSFENEEFSIRLSEYSDLSIDNKLTGKSITVNMVDSLLEESDLGR